MSLGYSVKKYFNKNVNYRWRIVDLTVDANYTVNGYSINAANCGLKGIVGVFPCGGGPCVPVWDYTNSKLRLFRAGAANGVLAECANDQANVVNTIVSCLVVGY